MSDLSIELYWELGNKELKFGKYLTDHEIKINDNIKVKAGSAPEYGGNINNLNPEQALAAAMSSCHMMTFLALAAKMKWPVVSYTDRAVAYIDKNSKGKMFVNKIELNPVINFKDNFKVSKEEMIKMQDRSHRYCFIANSLSDEVEVKIN
jgi:organic hydroperoxide reductase OsmC/OhrA